MTYSLHYISTDTGLNELLTITHILRKDNETCN